ncbi:hypothetical protein VTN96DRAFT_755 [Rasamsonia emersonii]
MILRSLPIHAAAIAAALTSLVDAKPLRHDIRQVAETHRINSTHYNDTSAVVLDVSLKDAAGRNNTSPLLYGWMFEDISHSGDGGIYAELIKNRAFQGSTSTVKQAPGISGDSVVAAQNPIVPFGPVLDGWRPIGDAKLSLDVLHPLSDALPVVLQIDIPWNATGEVGFLNEGWWGIDVRPQTYNASFYMLANAPRYNKTLTSINLSLRSNLTDDVWATTTIHVDPDKVPTFDYEQYQASIVNTVKAPNSNNTFAITFNADEVAGSTFYFGLVSLFPETFNNRPNGLRKDLAQGIKDMGAKFLRFPGGNNLEGYSIFQRWKWNETIGPLRYRKGRVGNWEYYNTNGLGLLEFLEWTEDLGMEPVLAVYAGFSLDIWGQEGTSYPEDRMDEIVQDILNELEYCMGDVNTHYGALRAQHGHPEPFDIKYIEIGNEDWFSSTYPYRFPIIYKAIKSAYPNITLISTAYNENANYTIDIPAGGMWDTHHYETPSFFLENFNYFDNWQAATNNTDVKIFVGEYSVYQIDTPDGYVNFSNPEGIHMFFPELVSAIAEAVYLLGAERNPNTVTMTSYAPSFQNLNWYNWSPNLVAFTANPDETVFSTSYYMQKMFANHRGTQTLPVKNSKGDFNPLWWVATIDEGAGVVYFKIVNSGNSSIPLTINLDQAYKGVNGTILTHPNLYGFNYLNNQTAIVPVPANITSPSKSQNRFDWDVPKYSVTVLQFDI